MAKRIPPKGTQEYRNYWRDRRVIDEIKRVQKEVEYCTANTEFKRVGHYSAANRGIKEALESFKEGWKL